MVRPIDASSQHHRRSLRLTGYDYRQAGAYFVTICVQSPSVSLGKIDGSSVILSPAGKLIETIWFELPLRFTGLVLDEFIVMPDHIHGILVLTGVCDVNTSSRRLGDVVGAFKSISTHEYVLRVREAGWPPFEGRLCSGTTTSMSSEAKLRLPPSGVTSRRTRRAGP